MGTPPSLAKTFALLNKNAPVNTKQDDPAPHMMPSAKARHTLERLIHGNPTVFDNEPLKPAVQSLFNWDGKNHTNKPLIRIFDEVIKNKGTYPQAVEMIGFLSAASPLLEADQIARILEHAKTTKTAFAPTLYTLTFAQRIKDAFEYLSPERRERMILGTWETIHNGRWWNTTAAITEHVQQEAVLSGKDVLDTFKKYAKEHSQDEVTALQTLDHAIWTEQGQANFHNEIKDNLVREVAQVAEIFRKQLVLGYAINPDAAIYLSAVPWLAPDQRPESPISSVLKLLNSIYDNEELDLKKPKKPNKFSEYFENTGLDISSLGQIDYIFDPNIVNTMEGQNLLPGVPLKLIASKAKLRENAKHMGNCTLSFESNMDRGEYALFYAKDERTDEEYNLAVHLVNSKWVVREVNSRYNRGVSSAIRDAFSNIVSRVPKATTAYKDMINARNGKDNKNQSLIYRYTIE